MSMSIPHVHVLVSKYHLPELLREMAHSERGRESERRASNRLGRLKARRWSKEDGDGSGGHRGSLAGLPMAECGRNYLSLESSIACMNDHIE